MHFKNLVELWPHNHGDLIEVKIKSSDLPLTKSLLVFLIDRRDEQQPIKIKCVQDCGFNMIQKHIQTRSENRPK